MSIVHWPTQSKSIVGLENYSSLLFGGNLNFEIYGVWHFAFFGSFGDYRLLCLSLNCMSSNEKHQPSSKLNLVHEATTNQTPNYWVPYATSQHQ